MSFRNSISCDAADLERIAGMCKQKADGLGFAENDLACALAGAYAMTRALRDVEYGDKPEGVFNKLTIYVGEWLGVRYAGQP